MTKAGRVRTLGVEEELLLLDEATGQVAPVAPELLERLGGVPWAKHELMRFQLETVTDVCTRLGELRAGLAAHRLAAPPPPSGSGAGWWRRASRRTAPPGWPA